MKEEESGGGVLAALTLLAIGGAILLVFYSPEKPKNQRVKPAPVEQDFKMKVVKKAPAPHATEGTNAKCVEACGVRRSVMISGVCNCRTEFGWKEVTEHEQ